MSDPAPSYTPSPYDASSSAALNNFWTPRVEGKDTGLSDADLGTITAQTQDQTTNQINESRRLGQAGQLRTGGLTTGGTESINQNADNSALAYRSTALNDVAIQNAVMKHNDQYTAAAGMQNFLNAERSNAFQIWQTQYYPWQTQQMTNLYSGMYNKQQNNATTNQWVDAGLKIGAALL